MAAARHDPAKGLWQAWRATKNLLELDEAGSYPCPLPNEARKMLKRHAVDLSAEFQGFGIMAGGGGMSGEGYRVPVDVLDGIGDVAIRTGELAEAIVGGKRFGNAMGSMA